MKLDHNGEGVEIQFLGNTPHKKAKEIILKGAGLFVGLAKLDVTLCHVLQHLVLEFLAMLTPLSHEV